MTIAKIYFNEVEAGEAAVIFSGSTNCWDKIHGSSWQGGLFERDVFFLNPNFRSLLHRALEIGR